MIKTKRHFEFKKPKVKYSFPLIAMFKPAGECEGLTVLFSSANAGTVLDPGKSKAHPVGHYSTGWNPMRLEGECDWQPLPDHESIVLNNKHGTGKEKTDDDSVERKINI